MPSVKSALIQADFMKCKRTFQENVTNRLHIEIMLKNTIRPNAYIILSPNKTTKHRGE